MQTMIALSTAWVGPGRPTVEETIRQAASAGFKGVELGAWGRMPAAGKLISLARELDITYTSVHNIAYRDGMPRGQVFGDALSSSDLKARRQAIDATVRSCELARAVGAGFVIIHAGEIEVSDGPDRQKHAQDLITAGHRKEAQRFMSDCMAERGHLSPPAVEAAAASLSEVFRRTGDFPMAVECRYHYHSIPQPGELDFLLTVLAGRPLYYWHDIGHAWVGEMLGLVPALSWLDTFGQALVGIHLHDAVGFKDHKVPGTGDVDFAKYAPYADDAVIKVMELPPPPEVKDVLQGKAHLEACGIE
jgi:sugar phosphate isomerase/epimerase